MKKAVTIRAITTLLWQIKSSSPNKHTTSHSWSVLLLEKVKHEAALRRIPAGGALAAQEAVTRFLVENFRSGSFAADPAQQHADGMPIDFGGNASGAPVGLAAGAQPKVSGGDPLRPSSSPADGLSGREAGSGPSGLIF